MFVAVVVVLAACSFINNNSQKTKTVIIIIKEIIKKKKKWIKCFLEHCNIETVVEIRTFSNLIHLDFMRRGCELLIENIDLFVRQKKKNPRSYIRSNKNLISTYANIAYAFCAIEKKTKNIHMQKLIKIVKSRLKNCRWCLLIILYKSSRACKSKNKKQKTHNCLSFFTVHSLRVLHTQTRQPAKWRHSRWLSFVSVSTKRKNPTTITSTTANQINIYYDEYIIK